MKILLLDIETAPNTAYVWGIFKENIPLARLLESSYVLCWSAKFYGDKDIQFDSVYKTHPATMLRRIHRLMSQADVIVHYNGSRFDIPILNKEFILHNIEPPAPYKQVDLLHVVRNQFRFTSNKLDYVSKQLGLKQKEAHRGFELWVDCMKGDAKAWKEMESYNKQDIRVLEELYDRLMPWIRTHPNHGVYSKSGHDLVCPKCGGNHYHRRGYAYTALMKYPRYQCQDCLSWFRGNKAETKKGASKFVHV